MTRRPTPPLGRAQLRPTVAVLCVLLPFAAPALASDSSLEDFGDVMQYVLPATAAGATWLNRDKEGFLQFG